MTGQELCTKYALYRRFGGKMHLRAFLTKKGRNHLRKRTLVNSTLQKLDKASLLDLVDSSVCLYDFLEIQAPRLMLPAFKRAATRYLDSMLGNRELLEIFASLSANPSEELFKLDTFLAPASEYLDKRQQRNLARWSHKMLIRYMKFHQEKVNTERSA